MSRKLDAIYSKSGRKAAREVLKRAAVAANYSTGGINPLWSEAGARNAQVAGARPDWKRSIFGELAKLTPASAPKAADPAPQNAISSGPATTETELYGKTRPESGTWQRLQPGDRLPFDDHYDELIGTQYDDDPDMVELRASLARWTRCKPRLRSGSLGRAYGRDADIEELRALLTRRRLRSGRSVAMDAAIQASATSDRAVPAFVMYRRLQPTQTVEQAIGTIIRHFGRLKDTGDFLSLRYVLSTHPPQTRLRELPAQQKQALAAMLARLELAAA